VRGLPHSYAVSYAAALAPRLLWLSVGEVGGHFGNAHLPADMHADVFPPLASPGAPISSFCAPQEGPIAEDRGLRLGLWAWCCMWSVSMRLSAAMDRGARLSAAFVNGDSPQNGDSPRTSPCSPGTVSSAVCARFERPQPLPGALRCCSAVWQAVASSSLVRIGPWRREWIL
jgi:hypothetical protein